MKTKHLISLIFLLIIIISNSFGQKNKSDCKYLKNEVDEFTKKTEVRTKGEEIFYEKKLAPQGSSELWCKRTMMVVGCNFNGINQLLFLLSSCSCSDNDFYSISLLLENGNVVDFSKQSESKYGDECNTYWQFYTVNDSTWSVLKSTPVKKIRVRYDNSLRTFELKEENQNKVMKVIGCVDELNIAKPIVKEEK